jgi:hypothetical protein
LTYRVELHATALAQIGGLPSDAFDALVSRLVDVTERPWDAMGIYSNEPEYRQVIFGTFGLGVPVHVVAARLGHADPAITLRVYAHVIRSAEVAAAEVFARVMGEAA